VALAQQPDRMRRIGALMNLTADHPESLVRVATFERGLAELGWIIGRNVRIDYRWTASDVDRYPRYAAELVALEPDVILTVGGNTAKALQQATHSVPIVFVTTIDPVGRGLVASLARPGGNATGFMSFEYAVSGKWLELLKQIAPRVTRAAVLRDPTTVTAAGMLGGIQAVAPSFGVELFPVDMRDAGEIERGITAFARAPNGGLIVQAAGLAEIHREVIITLAARHRLPAVYTYEHYVTSGGLVSYGPDPVDSYRQAARYVDRILKGENPADLPVQAPTKYKLAVNLKTAKALGLTVPETLLATADEVIQ
jgi:putative tryptophan/tyrosine transport system substrate-binding protein